MNISEMNEKNKILFEFPMENFEFKMSEKNGNCMALIMILLLMQRL